MTDSLYVASFAQAAGDVLYGYVAIVAFVAGLGLGAWYTAHTPRQER